MDRLVKPDVKEVEIAFKRGQKGTTTFRLSNLMHTMSVAVSLTTTNTSVFSFAQALSIIPPLSSSSYTLVLSQSPDQPTVCTPPDVITVKSAMLPTGKARVDDLRRLFSRPGPHIFRDATIPISLVGPHVAEYLISNHAQIRDASSHFNRAISGCSASQLTTLLESAVISGSANLVAKLIDAGGDVNCKDSEGRSMITQDGRTPIHVAASCGHVEVIRFCASIGGKCDVVDCNGCTPLHLAAEKGQIEAAECLLDCSSYIKYAVNKEGKTAFGVAVENGNSHLYGLLQLGDMLHRAARLGDVNGIRSCIAEGANVNERDENGWTPLHRAAFKGRIESVKVLLNHGGRVDAVDDAGYSPLHCAVEAGHVDVAMLLVSHGAKPIVKSLKGASNLKKELFKNKLSDEFSSCVL